MREFPTLFNDDPCVGGDTFVLKTFKAFKQYAGSNNNVHVLTDEEIKKIQKALLKIMDDFDMLCRKHGLTYFLTGGSALGARREKGFIPWDDDIDVMMPRKDYNKLPELIEKELNDKYWIQNLRTSDKYDLCFSKLRKKGTKYVEIFETEPDKAGLFLDIFPLEDTYNSPILRFMNGIIDEFLFFVASCVRIHQKKQALLDYAKDDNRIQQSIRMKSIIGALFNRKKHSREWFLYCERWQSKCHNPDSKYATVSCGRGHYFGEMYARDKVLPPREGEFEGRKYYVPKDDIYLLNCLYGKDFMTPCDLAKREMHCVLEWNTGTED